MDHENIIKRKEDFAAWITFIGDRVKTWKATLPTEISNQLNWTPESLLVIERYLLDNFKLEDQGRGDRRPALDAIVSYTGQVFKQNVPETSWTIDVEDETNIFYNLPYLVFKLGVPLSPHRLIEDALFTQSGNEIKERFDMKFKNWLEHKSYMDGKDLSNNKITG